MRRSNRRIKEFSRFVVVEGRVRGNLVRAAAHKHGPVRGIVFRCPEWDPGREYGVLKHDVVAVLSNDRAVLSNVACERLHQNYGRQVPVFGDCVGHRICRREVESAHLVECDPLWYLR